MIERATINGAMYGGRDFRLTDDRSVRKDDDRRARLGVFLNCGRRGGGRGGVGCP